MFICFAAFMIINTVFKAEYFNRNLIARGVF